MWWRARRGDVWAGGQGNTFERNTFFKKSLFCIFLNYLSPDSDRANTNRGRGTTNRKVNTNSRTFRFLDCLAYILYKHIYIYTCIYIYNAVGVMMSLFIIMQLGL